LTNLAETNGQNVQTDKQTNPRKQSSSSAEEMTSIRNYWSQTILSCNRRDYGHQHIHEYPLKICGYGYKI